MLLSVSRRPGTNTSGTRMERLPGSWHPNSPSRYYLLGLSVSRTTSRRTAVPGLRQPRYAVVLAVEEIGPLPLVEEGLTPDIQPCDLQIPSFAGTLGSTDNITLNNLLLLSGWYSSQTQTRGPTRHQRFTVRSSHTRADIPSCGLQRYTDRWPVARGGFLGPPPRAVIRPGVCTGS